jgi:uncharacterized protein with HEPN domain
VSRSGVELCDDIQRAIALVHGYMAGHATARQPSIRAELDFKTRDAVTYRLIIGEAAKFLLRNFASKIAGHSTAGNRLENVLKQAYSMRNVLIHQHWALREQVVRATAKDDLPPLGKAIEALTGDL